MRELEPLLPSLEPPAGGLPRLRHRIENGHARRWLPPQRWRTASAMACLCFAVAALAVWVPQWNAQRRQSAALAAALIDHPTPHMPRNGIRVVDGAAIELPSAQANVKLYLVQTAQPARPE